MQKTVLEKLEAMGYDKKKAKALIMAGQVFVNTQKMTLPLEKIDAEVEITVKEKKEYVSRGAYKLLGAIEVFGLDFNNKVVLDIGASTGGFTEVALLKGASLVYALDSGTNQLDYALRVDPRVSVMEKTNLKDIKQSMFAKKPNIVLCDVSFISLKPVFEVLGKEFKNVKLMALIKPEFEANSNQVQKGGFVPESLHAEIIAKVKGFANENHFILKGVDKSPIKGGKAKNTEYLSLWESE